jgi:radical SAM protein with 4Fe4S-binding SPASM domain
MCNIWKHPTDIRKEIQPKELEILPQLKFINITGGEPFARRDIEDIIEVAFSKAPRVVISTSGYNVEEILALAGKYPNIGIRISIEGLSTINDYLRGRDSGFDRGLKTLLNLRRMGIKDIGFGITVSNNNSEDMLELYELSRNLNMEFATASYHNSFYFHKSTNEITNKEEVTNNFYELIDRLLKEKSPKSWFRAFFNLGLINYIEGNRRFLPCEAGSVNFFIEPYGDVFPCNGLEERFWKESMGNIRNFSSFEELWYSKQAEKVRSLVRTCPKNCWMVGTAAPVMKKYIKHPLSWVIKHKIDSLRGKNIERGCLPAPYDVGQDLRQGDLRKPNDTYIQFTDEIERDKEQRITLPVVENIAFSEKVFYLKLQKANFSFKPGQNVSIAPHLRYHFSKDFSMCSSPNDSTVDFLIHVNRPNGVSHWLQQTQKGDLVDIVGPYGEFGNNLSTSDETLHLFIASGVGIGPFLGIIKHNPNLHYQVIHGVRNCEDLKLSTSIPESRIVKCVSREDGGDFKGRVTEYLPQNIPTPQSLIYVCGNAAMVREVCEFLDKNNIPKENINTETYYAY